MPSFFLYFFLTRSRGGRRVLYTPLIYRAYSSFLIESSSSFSYETEEGDGRKIFFQREEAPPPSLSFSLPLTFPPPLLTEGNSVLL